MTRRDDDGSMRWFVPIALAWLVVGPGCPTAGDDDAGDDDSGDDDSGDDDTCVYGDGDRTVSGQAYFFTMPQFGQIEMVTDVVGAEVYLFEDPSIRTTVDASDDFAFSLGGIPDDCPATLALIHDDFFPHMTATLPLQGADLETITFQSVSRELVALTTEIYGVDPDDPSVCHMSTTVTAIDASQDTVWAVGEPGATVTVEPEVPADHGPFYFNEMVLPDLTLTETTADGGVIVIGADPGTYHWTAHKQGLEFRPLQMRCEAGWLTNASPPWGMQVLAPR